MHASEDFSSIKYKLVGTRFEHLPTHHQRHLKEDNLSSPLEHLGFSVTDHLQ